MMNPVVAWLGRSLCCLACAALLTGSGFLHADDGAAVLPLPVPARLALTQSVGVVAAVELPARASNVHRITLGPVPAERMARERALPVTLGGRGVRPKIGFPRPIEALRSAAAVAALTWEALPDGGQVTAIGITSPAAAGLRLGMLIDTLPPTALLRFYSQADPLVRHSMSGREILALIERNIQSGNTDDSARTYWTPSTSGDEATVEIELPAGVSTATVRFAIPQISHLFVSLQAFEQNQLVERAAASCNLDVSCYLGSWDDQSRSVARMRFVEAGYSYTCTGTLLADRAGSETPYFLTANHCIADQTTASTLETIWFYRSASCNSASTSSAMTTLTGGATLLYRAEITDTSFFQLNRAAPAGSVFAGWWATLPPIGSAVTGIHHPQGDLQRISFGTLLEYAKCDSPSTTGSYFCFDSSAADADHMEVSWSQGITEKGSSGSGLWALFSDGRYYLVGQLHGGSSSCSVSEPDSYARFDLAYEAGLKRWLGGEVTPTTFLLTVSKTGSGSIASSPAGISCGTDCNESYNSGSSVTLTATAATGWTFSSWGGACTGTAPGCTVTLTAATSVTATFSLQTQALSVSKTGAGTGNVYSAPAGINCGTDCAESYATHTSVMLSATPDVQSTFTGWSGACMNTFGSCTVIMSSAKSVTANFAPKPSYALTVSKTGTGVVVSSPAGIDCGADCKKSYLSGSSISLTATPASGFVFSGWGGACAGTANSCTVTMTAARSVTANFTSTVPAPEMGADCLFNWAENTYSELFAPPATGSTSLGDYYYRYYSMTDSYLATLNSDRHLYYLGALSGGSILDLGPVAPWLDRAGCTQ